jgi:hypothetical protein
MRIARQALHPRILSVVWGVEQRGARKLTLITRYREEVEVPLRSDLHGMREDVEVLPYLCCLERAMGRVLPQQSTCFI